jgi:hypothetical protein
MLSKPCSSLPIRRVQVEGGASVVRDLSRSVSESRVASGPHIESLGREIRRDGDVVDQRAFCSKAQMIAGGLRAEPEAGEDPDELVRQATAGDTQVEVASEDRLAVTVCSRPLGSSVMYSRF